MTNIPSQLTIVNFTMSCLPLKPFFPLVLKLQD